MDKTKYEREYNTNFTEFKTELLYYLSGIANELAEINENLGKINKSIITKEV